MSFYDEFLKSLEETSEELESATEGLETEETPVEEEQTTEPEATEEVEDNVDEVAPAETEEEAEAAEESYEGISSDSLDRLSAMESFVDFEEKIEMIDLEALEASLSGDSKNLEKKIAQINAEIAKWDNRLEIINDRVAMKELKPEDASVMKMDISERKAKLIAQRDKLKAKAPATASATEVTDENETPAEESMIEVSDDEMLTMGMESILFLEALRAGCSSEEEYKNILSENATELQLYGVVDPVAIARESYEDEEDESMEVATEAKNIVRLNREAKISTEVARMSIGLAKKANDPLYKSYHKYSVLKRQFRDKIYAKYNSRAVPLARKAVMNGRNRAAMINSPAGNGIVARIDSRLKQLDKSARNMQAIKKDLNPSKPSMGKAKK